MEQRLVLLLAGGAIGLATLDELLRDGGLDELEKLDFLLSQDEEAHAGIYRIEMPAPCAPPQLSMRRVAESTLPMYRQIEYKAGHRFPFRKDIKVRGS